MASTSDPAHLFHRLIQICLGSVMVASFGYTGMHSKIEHDTCWQRLTFKLSVCTTDAFSASTTLATRGCGDAALQERAPNFTISLACASGTRASSSNSVVARMPASARATTSAGPGIAVKKGIALTHSIALPRGGSVSVAQSYTTRAAFLRTCTLLILPRVYFTACGTPWTRQANLRPSSRLRS